jgi:CRISPR-associated protein Cas1
VARLAAARARLRAEPALGVDALRGIEGAAAAAYFGGYTRLFAPALGFSARNRRPPRDPVNAVLSLAYTLLHYDAVRACQIAGLDPIIGFYHRLDFGRESLASDLIEPLRPAVDAWVWTRFREQRLRPEHFEQRADACLLGKAGRGHFYAGWEAFARPRRRLLRRLARQLAAELAEAVAAGPAPADADGASEQAT